MVYKYIDDIEIYRIYVYITIDIYIICNYYSLYLYTVYIYNSPSLSIKFINFLL